MLHHSIRWALDRELKKFETAIVWAAHNTESTPAKIEAMNQDALYDAILSDCNDPTNIFHVMISERIDDDQERFEYVRHEIAELVRQHQGNSELLQAWQKAERREEEKQALYARVREEAIIASMWVHAHAA